jgi:hypothetical protein
LSIDLPNLRKLELSPLVNPLMEPTTVTMHRRYVRTATNQEFRDLATGEIRAVSMIHIVEDRDDAEFVKVFSEGVKAAYDLSRTGGRVFQSVLDAYQKEKMTGGYADSVRLFWFRDGLNGESIGMSEKTFQRGLKELLMKKFIAARTNELFWVNPALFFKGDRVAFVREYRRRSASPASPTDEDTALADRRRR